MESSEVRAAIEASNYMLAILQFDAAKNNLVQPIGCWSEEA